MRLHGYRMPYQPQFGTTGGASCRSGAPNEIWSYGDEVYEICRKYIDLRENMRPYICRLMKDAHIDGHPVIRPLFYDCPEDKKCWEIENEFMFGPDILVAPVLHYGERTRKVYFPANAVWKDYWSGKIYPGGDSSFVDAPLNQIPFFLRNGKDVVG